MTWTATDLIAAVGRAYFMPTSQNTFSDADLLAFADEELSSYFIPRLMSAAGAYNEYALQYTTDTNNKIRVPSRAVGSSLSYIRILQSGGDPDNDRHWWYLPGGIRTEDANRITDNYMFSFYNSYLRLNPEPDAGRTIEVGYVARPGQLVVPSNTTYVTTVATVGSTTFTVASSSTVNSTTQKFDIIKATPNFEYIAFDNTSTTTTTTITPSGGVPAQLEVGDYIVRQGYSPVPQLPVEWFPYLAARVAYRCASAFQDDSGMSKLAARIDGYEAAIIQTVESRMRGSKRFVSGSRRHLI